MRPKLMDWEGERVPKIDARCNLDASMHQKIMEKYVVLEVEIAENREKNSSKNYIFFAYDF